jgi:hypothetical protein
MVLKVWQISLFVFFISASLSYFDATDPFGADLDIGGDSGFVNMTESYENMTSVSGLGVGDVLQYMNLFVQVILNATIFLPFLLERFYVTGWLNWMLTAGGWLMFGVGMFEVVTGRVVSR